MDTTEGTSSRNVFDPVPEANDMNSHVHARLAAIQQALMAHHAGGVGMPTAMSGGEREIVLNDFFRTVLPGAYRFGRGAITDSTGQLTGQLETVLESPFGPAFAMPTPSESLFLAESVIAVVEVKSDLTKQWDEVESTVSKVRKLRRHLHPVECLALESSPDPPITFGETIPCYAFGYCGHQTLDGLRERLNSTDSEKRPDGAMVIQSGCFVGVTGSASGVEGLYRFLCELLFQANALLGIAYPRLLDYLIPGAPNP